MANTYTQLLVQVVFAVKYRQNLIPEIHRETIQKFICAVISDRKCKPLAIYCNPDHIHILIGMNPEVQLSGLVRDIKSVSSRFIKEERLSKGSFAWQNGYGAFTYGQSSLDNVVKYILNQKEHHRKKTFKEEYIETLNKFNIEFDNKYVFDFFDS